MLYPLSLVYTLVHRLKQRRDAGREYVPEVKVISIGNITSGGGGKTPLTIELAGELMKRGYRVGISHRGYRGKYEAQGLVIRACDGIAHDPASIGDEAYMIAKALPQIPVAIGRNRRDAIQKLISIMPDMQVVILDDAHQNKKIHHDLNVVVFNDEIGLGNGFVLPAGYLRESPRAISGKDIIMFYQKVGNAATISTLMSRLRNRSESIFRAKAEVTGLCDHLGGIRSVESIRTQSLALVSGIASPASFEKVVNRMGLSWEKHFAYSDHCSYEDVTALKDWLARDPQAFLLCTEKDLMKLARYPELADRLIAVKLGFIVEDKEAFYRLVESRLELYSH